MTEIIFVPDGKGCMMVCDDQTSRRVDCCPVDAEYYARELGLVKCLSSDFELVFPATVRDVWSAIYDLLKITRKDIAVITGQIEDEYGSCNMSDADVRIADYKARQLLADAAREIDNPFERMGPHRNKVTLTVNGFFE